MTDEAWIDTVRLARDLGTVHSLLPRGVSTLLDVPYRLFDALRHAMMVVNWQDNYTAEEQPPKRIWLKSARLQEWFRDVAAKRDAKMSGGDSWDYEIEDPVQNEAAGMLVHG